MTLFWSFEHLDAWFEIAYSTSEKNSLETRIRYSNACINAGYANLNPLLISKPRPVAGFRGTVRYASINAHDNKVTYFLLWRQLAALVKPSHFG